MAQPRPDYDEGRAQAADSLGKWDNSLASTASSMSSCVFSRASSSSSSFGDTLFSGRVAHSGLEGDGRAIYYDTSLASCIKDMVRHQPKAALERATRTSRALLLHISDLMSQESAYHLLPALVKSQQILETAETCKVLDSLAHSHSAVITGGDFGANSDSDSSKRGTVTDLQYTEEMLRKWSVRLSGGTSSGESAVMKEGVLSLRISLMTQLLHRRDASACQALGLMRQINGMIPHGQAGDSVVHALSPLAYRLKAAISGVPVDTLLVGLAGPNRDNATTFAPIGSGSSSSSSKSKSAKKYGSRGASSDPQALPSLNTSKLWEAEWKLQKASYCGERDWTRSLYVLLMTA